MTAAEIEMPNEYNSSRRLRVWQPGDGLHCSFASRASRNRPCGRPVAVRMSQNLGGGPVRKSVVCAYHLTSHMTGGMLSADAENAAREKVLAEHWDEYQAAIREYMQPLIDNMVEGLSDELKALVLAALAQDDERRDDDS